MGIAIAIALYAVMIVALVGLVVLVPLFVGALVYDALESRRAERRFAALQPVRSRALYPNARLTA